MRRVFSLSVFIFSFASLVLGWSLVTSNDERSEFHSSGLFEDSEWRNPAAIKRNYDFSNLNSRFSGSALMEVQRKRLLKSIRTYAKGGRIAIELGHFVVKGDSGTKEFACDYYDRVRLEFVGVGLAESGHLPKLTIEGKCEISRNINRMQPLWLPIAEMQSYQPRELTSHFFEKEKIHVNIENLSYSWPMSWNLVGVKVYNEVKHDRSVELRVPASQKGEKTLKIEWKN